MKNIVLDGQMKVDLQLAVSKPELFTWVALAVNPPGTVPFPKPATSWVTYAAPIACGPTNITKCLLLDEILISYGDVQGKFG
jgi:hypothetical protein